MARLWPLHSFTYASVAFWLQELACLWDWQHRRVAAGMPADWTPKEAETARKAVLAQGEKVRVGGCRERMQPLESSFA